MAWPRFLRSRTAKKAARTSGNITLNSTSWANVDTGIDLVVKAEAGDELEISVSGLMGSESPTVTMDAVTVVSGSPVNSVASAGAAPTGTTGAGVEGWTKQNGAVYHSAVGVVLYTVQAGDVATDGTVTLRLRYRTGSAANVTLWAATANPLRWHVKNLGPLDPN